MFELKQRDAGGRIGKFTIGDKSIQTPTLAVVINPNNQIIPPKELKKFSAEIIITNSYIISKSPCKEKILEQGLHKFFDWSGPIFTDSGTFQMYSQNIKDIQPEQMLNFQKSIKSDIITPVDLFTLPTDSKKIAKQKLSETIKRIKKAREKVSFLNAPIQGGLFLDLRKQACQSVAKLHPEIFSIGGIVPLMEQYRFQELFDIVLTCKSNLPPHIPVHAFGAGHPMVLSILACFGIDLFDSAMYSLSAKQNRYLTNSGTYLLNDQYFEEFPCSCPVCSSITPKELRSSQEKESLLSRHNLYVTFQEIREIRNAIRGEYLWDLAYSRSKSNLGLSKAFLYLSEKYKLLFKNVDKFPKTSSFNWDYRDLNLRSEVIKAKEALKHVKKSKSIKINIFNRIPIELRDCYPFNRIISASVKGNLYKDRPQLNPEKELLAILNYQFGKNKYSKFKSLKFEISRKTRRIRRIYKNKALLGTLEPSTNFLIPTIKGAEFLGKSIKKVFVKDNEVADLISIGNDLLSKFVFKSSSFIYPGEQVAIVSNKKIINVGKALLNSDEMKFFKRGVAVKVR